ncbi:MAG: phenylalanine--tRNA ligase subunit beta [Firmicutes bacterium]|nr:phenylalanine--tRNA ligase subunit beta [Bacillota bacterium]
MVINLDWVKDYIDISDEDLKELAVKITKAGINVEKVISSRIDNLVIGEVLNCVDHPNSDHLHICQVNIGEKVEQIVCGAPNVKEGIKVIVALPGCVLPGDFKIETGVIRGVESNGMICALYELGLEPKNDETHAKGIEILNTDLEAGTDANEYLKTNTTVYELDIHKHRNNDCYYHIGFAYEIASILNKKVTLPECNYSENSDCVENHIEISVETDKCPYYTAKMVKNVRIGESPDFIKQRLLSVGLRPINNVVDISNYVMLEYGQPLHFFDKNKLGSKILVRNAEENEEIITLDGIERKLQSNDIVITDGSKPVCIAGVMGGANTEVDEQTTDVLIESAIFDATAIRYTASRLDLRSEASIRYGKGLSFEYTDAAIERACHLLEKYAGATVLKGTLKHDKANKEKKIVTFKTDDINSLLGMKLTDKDVEKELERLGFMYEVKDDGFVVEIPYRRLDIDPNVNDIAEEIGRLYGYQNLTSTLPVVPSRRGVYVGDVKIRKEISKRLRALGLNETKTYTLVSPENAALFRYNDVVAINLSNPMSVDKSIIRTSILGSLLEVFEYNKARNVKDILLYEIAKTYDVSYQEDTKVAMLVKGNYIINNWQNIENKCDFYLIKGIVENLLDYLGFKNRYSFVKAEVDSLHPGISAKIMIDREEIGIIGRVHPSLQKDDVYVAELSMTKLYEKTIKPIKFKEASRYPEITKDVAFVVDNEVESEVIKKQIKSSGGNILDLVEVFDVYNNFEAGKKSIAYKLTFKDSSKTLQDDEVMAVFNKIIADVEEKLGAKLRG